jgi:hypothetical protein
MLGLVLPRMACHILDVILFISDSIEHCSQTEVT